MFIELDELTYQELEKIAKEKNMSIQEVLNQAITCVVIELATEVKKMEKNLQEIM